MRRAYSVLLGTVSAVTLLWAGPCLGGGEAVAAQQSVAAREQRAAGHDELLARAGPRRDEPPGRSAAGA